VAIGAAIQAGVLAGDVTGILLLDVSPLSLGVERWVVMTKIIPATPRFLPRSRKSSHPLWMVRAMWKSTSSKVSGRCLTTSLGTFRLDGAALRGVPQIEVTFDIDANGILNVCERQGAVGAVDQGFYPG